MTFSASMLRGANGVVDHRLARRALINEVKRGRISKDSVCDAHPELIRAARHLGEETTTPCPICEEVNVVLLTTKPSTLCDAVRIPIAPLLEKLEF